MSTARKIVAALLVAVGCAFLYLAISGDEHVAVRRATQLLAGVAWLAFAFVTWRERRAHA